MRYLFTLLYLNLGCLSFAELTSLQPKDSEIFASQVFSEPLVPTHQAKKSDTAELANTLSKFIARKTPDDFSSLEKYLSKNPDSRWSASIGLNLGLLQYRSGYFSKCMPTYLAAWKAGKNATDLRAKANADRAAGEYVKILARLGRKKELRDFLEETSKRTFLGQAAELILAGREGLEKMEKRPEISFRCGPMALSRILANQKSPKWSAPAIADSKSSPKGMSLTEVAAISAKVGLNYRPAKRAKGAPFVIPCVVHWKVGHYAALVGKGGGKFHSQDPTFENDTWHSLKALEAESSGYFLVPEGPLPKGWSEVGDKEAKTIFGKGTTSSPNPGETGDDDHSPNEPGTDCGMAVYSFHTMLASLRITDTPISYSPPYGYAMNFRLSYAQREASQPANINYTNFGQRWNCNWLGYIEDNPSNPAAAVRIVSRGGGFHQSVVVNGAGDGTYVTAPVPLHPNKHIASPIATRIPYEVRNADGSVEVYGHSNGSTVAPRKVFLTKLIDPAGNETTLTYDAQMRISLITDPLGRSLSLSYNHSTDPYKVTSVSDPFNRSASFTYDSSGRLIKITDTIGIESVFGYDGSSDFIDTLITPYGTSIFTTLVDGRIRRITATDPEGSTEVLETNDLQSAAISNSDPSAPTGMFARNSYLDRRNSFYWDKKRWKDVPGDYSKAHVYHWLHGINFTTMSGLLESERPPLQGRIWYNYPGQSNSYSAGTSSYPSKIGRVLDDGTTQLRQYEYNDLGKMTKLIDPIGRTFSYIYHANDLDVAEIRQTRGASNELIGSYTYSPAHRPLTYTDAAGNQTIYTWNAQGQITSSTNALNETTTFTYYTTDLPDKQRRGRLHQVNGALAGNVDIVTFDYDSRGNLAKVTLSDGYYVSYTYDTFDRLSKVTFPDGTFSETTYLHLDPATSRDRQGRITSYTFDSLRRMKSMTDPANRTTRYTWCKCGDLQKLIDAMGRITSWHYDIAGRVTAKQYTDGSRIRYTYELLSGRLLSRKDAKGQRKVWQYNTDNTISSYQYFNAEHITPNVSFTYDPDHRRMKSMTDGTGVTLYDYHPFTNGTQGAGRLSSTDGPYQDDTLTYTYDQLGRRKAYAINGIGETRSFDALGRVTTVNNPIGQFDYTYIGSTRRMDTVTCPNGMTTEYDYHPLAGDFRLKDIIHSLPGDIEFSRHSYEYSAVGNITRWTQIFSQAGINRSWLCGYDAADQLTSVTSQHPVTLANLATGQYNYSYDPAGNRLTETIDGVTANSSYNALNQLMSHSKNGAAVLPEREYEWDAENRLIGIKYTGTNEKTEFKYNGQSLMREIREIDSTVLVDHQKFIWRGLKRVEQRNGNNDNIEKRYFDQGMQFAGIGGVLSNQTFANDHLGSIRGALSTEGSLSFASDFDPWGNSVTIIGGLNESQLGYTGHFKHKNSKSDIAPFRIYNSSIACWLSRDPIEESGGVNLYGYVENNPIVMIDPLGLQKLNWSETYNKLDHVKKNSEAARKNSRAIGAHVVKTVGGGYSHFSGQAVGAGSALVQAGSGFLSFFDNPDHVLTDSFRDIGDAIKGANEKGAQNPDKSAPRQPCPPVMPAPPNPSDIPAPPRPPQ